MHRVVGIVLSSTAFLLFSLLLFAPVEWLLAARKTKGRAPTGDWLHFWVNSIVVPLAAVTILALIGGTIRVLLRDGWRGQSILGVCVDSLRGLFGLKD